MNRFEYRTFLYKTKGFYGEKVDEKELQDQLNEFGREGWELVSCTSSNQGYGETKFLVFVFKREI